MHFSLIHLDAVPADDEEVYLVVPGPAKVTIAVPLDALSHFLPILEQATDGHGLPTCAACSARLPAMALPVLEADVDTMDL